MLFFESSRWPGEIHVTLAHLDSSEGLAPQAHAYWSSRVPWADFSRYRAAEGRADRARVNPGAAAHPVAAA